MLFSSSYTRYWFSLQARETLLSWPSVPPFLSIRSHLFTLGRCDICHLFPWSPGTIKCWKWQPLQWELTTLIWVWRVLVALARRPTPKVVLAKESPAFPVQSHVAMNLPFSLVPTARSSENRLCVDISILLFICWRCLHVPVICTVNAPFCVYRCHLCPWGHQDQPDQSDVFWTHSLGNVLHR